VPASELAKLTTSTQLYLHQNKGLTITASGKQEIERAAPNAKFGHCIKRASDNCTRVLNTQISPTHSEC